MNELLVVRCPRCGTCVRVTAEYAQATNGANDAYLCDRDWTIERKRRKQATR